MEPDDSVTQWIQDLKEGRDEAASRLVGRYFERVMAIARQKLDPRVRRVEDAEDVANHVFASLCRRAAEGEFALLANRDELWRLLIAMTARKAASAGRRWHAMKRGRGAVRGESAVAPAPGLEGGPGPAGFDRFFAEEPTPRDYAVMAETLDEWMEQLGDDTLRRVVRLKLEGHTQREIAGQLGVTERSVERKIQRVRQRWEGLLADEMGGGEASP